MISEIVAQEAQKLAAESKLPAYVYDLRSLRMHAAKVRAALSAPGAPEIFYAAKANPDVPILRAVASYVDGIEVASGGELSHVRGALPTARLAFGGPGKTDEELSLALDLDVERIHVESPYELNRLARIAMDSGRSADILLRVNLAGDRAGVALAMSGPFGMDPELVDACTEILHRAPALRLRGVHAHLTSGLTAPAALQQTEEILDWARPWLSQVGCENPEFNVGGGMAVDYTSQELFDWQAYGHAIARLTRPGETLRIEPGRSITVYAGWYVTEVLDVKQAHRRWYVVLRGGTMQLRTPVTKQHNQPFTILPATRADVPFVQAANVTLVGQLCTPKDVFARDMPVSRIAVGDVVAFSMAGAYAWNISHHDFLMHPKPSFIYLDTVEPPA